MSTTHLFVELLVIGFGAALSLALFIAGIFRIELTRSFFGIKLSFWPFIVTFSYVLGIIEDRLIYHLFNKKRDKNKKEILKNIKEYSADEVERTVMESSDELNFMINYNRSRARICRSWCFNFFLGSFALLFFHFRTNQITLPNTIPLVLLGMFLAVSCYFIGNMLERDHFFNIRDSFLYIMKKRKNNF